MDNHIPEHPTIAAVLRAGMPSDNDDTVYCGSCGRDMTNEVMYEDRLHECLCEDCLLMLHRITEAR